MTLILSSTIEIALYEQVPIHILQTLQISSLICALGCLVSILSCLKRFKTENAALRASINVSLTPLGNVAEPAVKIPRGNAVLPNPAFSKSTGKSPFNLMPSLSNVELSGTNPELNTTASASISSNSLE